MMLVMAFFYVVRIDSGLALIVAGAIPVLGISVYLILRKGFPYFLKMQQKVDAVNAVVRENLINMRVVKSSACRPPVNEAPPSPCILMPPLALIPRLPPAVAV